MSSGSYRGQGRSYGGRGYDDDRGYGGGDRDYRGGDRDHRGGDRDHRGGDRNHRGEDRDYRDYKGGDRDYRGGGDRGYDGGDRGYGRDRGYSGDREYGGGGRGYDGGDRDYRGRGYGGGDRSYSGGDRSYSGGRGYGGGDRSYSGGRGGYDRGRGNFRGGRGPAPTVPCNPGPITMLSNHYKVRVLNDKQKVFKHLVVITSTTDENARMNCGMRQELFERALKVEKVTAVLAYDGDRIMVSRTPVQFDTNLKDRRQTFNVCCTVQSEVSLGALSEELEDASKEALQVLDIIMKAGAKQQSEVGTSQTFLHNSDDAMRFLHGESTCLWMGHWQTCQTTWSRRFSEEHPQIETTLILNTASSPAQRDMPLDVWTKQVMGESILDMRRLPPPWASAFEGKIRGHKFETRHLPPKRSVRIAGISSETAASYTFDYEGETISVLEYFRQRYHIQLRFPDAPLIQLAPKKKELYMPAELIYVSRQKLPQVPRESVKRQIIEIMTMEPGVRANYIRNTMGFVFKENPVLKHFGVDLQDEMLSIDGEILEPPVLSYRRPGNPDADEYMPVSAGKWNLMNKAFVEPQNVANWGLISFLEDFRMQDIKELFNRHVFHNAEKLNMRLAPMPRLSDTLHKLEDIDEVAIRLRNLAAENKRLDVIFVFIDRPSTIYYNRIKSAIDEIAPTQVLTAEKTPLLNRKDRGVDGHIGNILSKVNMKRGGVCQHIDHNRSARPALKTFLRDPKASCVIGCDLSLRRADMTPRTAVRDALPSITALVCSLDPQCGRYLHSFRAQHSGTESVDELVDMLTSVMTRRTMLMNAEKWPHRLIFLRDGLSDGSMAKVAGDEIQFIRSAYEQAKQTPPQLLYVSVRRRHQTRFFPRSAPSSANMPPGTCVFDTLSLAMPYPNFYLISHAGIKGTSHPARYVILYDTLREATPDLKSLGEKELVKSYAHLVFQLCHLYGRCQRSVSVPAPIYYANLLTNRARIHVNDIVCQHFGVGLISDSGSMNSGGASKLKDAMDLRDVDKTLAMLNKKLKEVETARMHFYC